MKKKITAVCLAVAFLFVFSIAAYAKTDSNVVFSGDAEEFIFLDGSDSLFDNFRGIMPGETRSQDIILKNDDYREMKFYMSADMVEALGEGTAFGAVYQITLSKDGVPFFDGKLGGENDKDKGFLGDDFLLATLPKGESARITMDLYIDGDSMDNSYQDTAGLFEFVFSVEHDDPTDGSSANIPETPQGGGNVTTGDSLPLLALAGGGVCGAAALVGAILLKKRRERGE